MIVYGSEVCVRDPRIIVQSLELRFMQPNHRMVQTRTLRITYICIIIYKFIAARIKKTRIDIYKVSHNYICRIFALHI